MEKIEKKHPTWEADLAEWEYWQKELDEWKVKLEDKKTIELTDEIDAKEFFEKIKAFKK